MTKQHTIHYLIDPHCTRSLTIVNEITITGLVDYKKDATNWRNVPGILSFHSTFAYERLKYYATRQGQIYLLKTQQECKKSPRILLNWHRIYVAQSRNVTSVPHCSGQSCTAFQIWYMMNIPGRGGKKISEIVRVDKLTPEGIFKWHACIWQHGDHLGLDMIRRQNENHGLVTH